MAESIFDKKIFRNIFKFHPLKKSFSYAFQGLWYMFLCHRNMRIILLSGILAVSLGLYLEITRIEFIILLVTISVVFIAEMFNTAIELIIDMFTEKYHVLLKIIKDISAGVVLIACLNAVAVGYFLFFKRIVFIFK
ncbi:MAG: diacylglycerol kinase family protein [Candidatus Omnitrophica bacterium]|nr:diacylglycerol kinase family protein [Candidatus Omnitrophota bacterium]MDD5236904.1 diacylglycerol kinase family protein [Candidatus Omnitrophota bacterium]MDD5610402.1 diacylglycerol kinase family protein [Candidatus Omnitrophota bacterium]